jgi:hypothetical protein
MYGLGNGKKGKQRKKARSGECSEGKVGRRSGELLINYLDRRRRRLTEGTIMSRSLSRAYRAKDDGAWQWRSRAATETGTGMRRAAAAMPQSRIWPV